MGCQFKKFEFLFKNVIKIIEKIKLLFTQNPACTQNPAMFNKTVQKMY